MESSLHYLMMINQLRFYKVAYSELEQTELTIGQPKILEYLCTHIGCLQKDIAKGCCIKAATVTSLLLRMEEAGMIQRISDADKRSHRVYPTEKGKALYNIVRESFCKTENYAFEGFSEDEKLHFKSMMIRISENLNRITEK